MPSLLSRLSEVRLDDREQAALGQASPLLRLRRVFPYEDGRAGLEYECDDRRCIAAQWCADAAELGKILRQTAGASPMRHPFVCDGDEQVLVQPGGADRKLLGLDAVATGEGSRLLVHRPERRAVVESDGGGRFTKVVRPDRVAALVHGHIEVAKLPGRLFDMPNLVEVDPPRGRVITERLAGVAIYYMLDRHISSACGQLGQALRSLHATPPTPLPVHGPDAELGIVRSWVRKIRPYDPGLSSRIEGGLAQLRLPELPPSCVSIVHRDLHDKQVFVDGDRIGLLDFDMLACGDPAIDTGNFLGHLTLRRLQGRLAVMSERAGSEAFLRGYNPDPAHRVRAHAYRIAALLRLAAVYAVRPGWPGLSELILSEAMGQIECATGG